MKKKETDKEQSKRFVDKAKEIGADESPEAFERIFKKIVSPKNAIIPLTQVNPSGNISS